MAMRRILVDHARGKFRLKRAATGERVAFLEDAASTVDREVDLIALDDALRALGAIDSRKVKVVEMRYFVGLTIEETAEALGVAPATVKRDWEFARLWLLRDMTGGGHSRA